MNEKRYTAADMRQALKLVRDDLGPDAVILSNQRTQEGVEILATADFDAAAESSRSARTKQMQQKPTPDQAARPAAGAVGNSGGNPGGNPVENTFADLLNQHQRTPAGSAATAGANAQDPLLDTMRSEIQHLRNLLRDQMQNINDDFWSMQHPIMAGVGRRLKTRGLSEQLTRSLIQDQAAPHTVDDGWALALGELEQQLVIAEQEPMVSPGVMVFMGPTGAGKTTTVAKLAVRHALKHGRDDLALITTDHSRIAAYEQLCTIGRIIDVPVRRVDANNSMAEVLNSLSHKRHILVDMAGMPEASPEAAHHLDQLQDIALPVSRLLVLPATTQGAVLQAVLESMQPFGVDGCVLTKLDEANSIGEALGLVVENKVPVTYITDGQAIPQDLAVASTDNLMAAFSAPTIKDKAYKVPHTASNSKPLPHQPPFSALHRRPAQSSRAGAR